jgi:hypothetical protein
VPQKDRLRVEIFNVPDELPMRPAKGRVGTCFCFASLDGFTSGKNRDNSIGLLHPVVKPLSADCKKAAVETARR